MAVMTVRLPGLSLPIQFHVFGISIPIPLALDTQTLIQENNNSNYYTFHYINAILPTCPFIVHRPNSSPNGTILMHPNYSIITVRS